MNHSGDAAEQIVRMSLEGVEVVARITGTAAKELAVFLIAALKSDNAGNSKLKLKGKARLESMLKSGKPLEIFSVKESDLQTFAQGAKQYGIVYCVLRDRKNTPDGLCDIMVKADDAPKINRLVERFKFATVDKAKIESGGESPLTKPHQEKSEALTASDFLTIVPLP
ncbi:MAG: PcfB family protein, partial [Oscillospiraceae bacterium]|nr:PcfB family protein [Oscillospiraceae bacterium]